MKVISLIFLLTIFFISCKKEQQFLACTNDCKTFQLQGRAYIGTTNLGLPNTKFRLRWEPFGNGCIYCPGDKYDIYAGKTDASGNFKFTVTVDSSRFSNSSLKLITPDKDNFMNSFTGYVMRSNINQDRIKIVYYPTTTLTLKLFKRQNDVLKFVNISHEWVQINGDGRTINITDYSEVRPIAGGDTTIKFTTVADIPTIVKVSKRFPDNSSIDIKDSIICRKNQNNMITMYY